MGKCFLFLLLRGMSPVSARLALPPALAHPLGARHMFFFGSRQLVVAQVVSLFSSIILERSFPTRRRFFFLLLLQTGDGRRRTVEKLKKERKKKESSHANVNGLSFTSLPPALGITCRVLLPVFIFVWLGPF